MMNDHPEILKKKTKHNVQDPVTTEDLFNSKIFTVLKTVRDRSLNS